MLISYKYNFIFIKTQKTAGTSLEICLSKFLGENDVITDISPPDEVIRQEKGGRGPQRVDDFSYLYPLNKIWRKLKGHEKIFNSHMSLAQLNKLKINLSDFEIVTISRNPWEVNASLYYYEKSKRPEKVTQEFNEWVVNNSIENFDKMKLGEKYYPARVLRYSDINVDFERWISDIGIPEEASVLLSNINAKSGIKPKGLNYFSIYNDASRKLVAAKNRYEIDKFGYEFNSD